MFGTCGKEATLCAGAELSLSSYTKFLTGCDFFWFIFVIYSSSSFRDESTWALSCAGCNSRSSMCCCQGFASSQNLFHTSRGVLSKCLVGEGVQPHREENVFLVPGTGTEIR